MLRSFLFLELKQAKNWFRRAKEDPKKLVPVIFMGGFLIVMIVALFMMPPPDAGTQTVELNIFLAILFGIGMLLVGIVMLNGIFKSTVLFKKADVNFLFTAPVAPQTVLMFGMIRSFYTYILSTFFILYQAANLHSLGITLGQIILLMLVVAWAAFSAGICGMFLYAKSLGNSLKRILAVVLVVLPLLAVLVWFGWRFYASGFDIGAAVARFAGSPLLVLFPFVGWMIAPMQWVLLGPTVWNILGTVLFLAIVPFLMLRLYHTPVDYYEDAINLMDAKQTQEVRQRGSFSEQLEAQRQAEARKARVRRSGFGKGSGAKMLFFRLQKEEARLHRLPYLVRIIFPALLVPAMLFVGTHFFELPRVFYAQTIGFLLFVFLIASFVGSMRSSLLRLYTEDNFLLLPLKPSQKFFNVMAYDFADRFLTVFPVLLFTALASGYLAGGVGSQLTAAALATLFLLSFNAWLMFWQTVIFRLMGDLANPIAAALFIIGQIFVVTAFMGLTGFTFFGADAATRNVLLGAVALSGLIPFALLLPLGTSLLKRGRR